MTRQDHQVDLTLAGSRPAGIARELLGAGADVHRFQDRPVLLTGEVATLRTVNGRSCLLHGLRLLACMMRDLTVAVPAETGDLITAVREEAARVGFGAPITVIPVQLGEGEPNYDRYDAILSVGRAARPELPWTVINADGWLARVSSGSCDLPAGGDQANPMAALAAASLGVSEVFKRLLAPPGDQGVPFDGVSFNLFSYQPGDEDSGPAIDRPIDLDILVVGAGAIGSGVVGVLRELTVTGRVEVIDRQAYADENLGTCLLVGPSDVGRAKAEVAAEQLRDAGIAATGRQEEVSDYRQRVGMDRPAVILNGLDNVEARHEIQGLWPDLVIDGAIGPLNAQVSRHPWDEDEDVACLRCLFQLPVIDTTAESVRMTGLRAERVVQGDELVTEQDVVEAPEERREYLRQRLGKQICSIIPSEEIVRLSGGEEEVGFAPSAPFVACLSASMVVGELVKHALGLAPAEPLEPRYQIDMLIGPDAGQPLPMGRRADCTCVTRRTNIETLRRRTRERAAPREPLPASDRIGR